MTKKAWKNHAGPKTAIAIFCYGGAHQSLLHNFARDCGNTAKVNMMSYMHNDINSFKPNLDLIISDLEKYSPQLPMTHKLSVDNLKKIHEKIFSVGGGCGEWIITVMNPPQDAAIDRARSMVATTFLQQLPSDVEVLIMLDHDLEWTGANNDPNHPDPNYEGDLLHLARQAHDNQAVIGAAVSKKSFGQGFATLLKRPTDGISDKGIPWEGVLTLGAEGLYEAFYVGGAMTAYPRKALEAVAKTLPMVAPGFWPLFMPSVVPHPAPHASDGKYTHLHLSEDWAFCGRWEEINGAGSNFISSKPRVAHHGGFAYTLATSMSQPTWHTFEELQKIHAANVPLNEANLSQTPSKMISVLHATRGRPDRAKRAYEVCMERAQNKNDIEYIWSIDDNDSFSSELLDYAKEKNIRVIIGHNRGCVDAFNQAAYQSNGAILFQMHDDLECPQNWDTEIARRIPDVNKPVVLKVGDAVPLHVNENPDLLTVLIGTRTWFKQCGYFWNPDFVSIHCDSHMTEMAKKYGVFIDARDLIFMHHWEGPNRDDVQKKSYSSENWNVGTRMLALHRASNFPQNPELWRGI